MNKKLVSLDELTRYDGKIKDSIASKQDKMQYTTMPNADASNVGKIIQYIGETTENYTNGYFYKGVSETENDVTTYSWSNIDVQGSSDSDKLPIYDFYSTITMLSSAGATTLSADDRSSLSEIINDVYSKGHHSFGINFSYKKNYGSSICFTNTDNVGTSLIENKPTTYTFYTLTTQNSDYQSLVFIYTWRLYIRMSWNGNIATVTEATIYRTSGGFISTSNTMAYTPTSNYHPATKKYVDDAVASAGGGAPAITISLSQVVSQSPLTLAMTSEQQAILENDEYSNILFDGSALGMLAGFAAKAETSSSRVTMLIQAPYFDTTTYDMTRVINYLGVYDKTSHNLIITQNKQVSDLTPVSDIDLANKKYVDDAVAGAGGGSDVVYTDLTSACSLTASNYDAEVIFNIYQNQQATLYGEINDIFTKLGNGETPVLLFNCNAVRTIFSSPNQHKVVTQIVPAYYYKVNNNWHIEISIPNAPNYQQPAYGIERGNSTYIIYYDSMMSSYHISYINNTTRLRQTYLDEVLTMSNTTSFTPTADYHPATKKYVDDSITELTTTVENTATNNDIDSLFN